jgi:MFS family permease
LGASLRAPALTLRFGRDLITVGALVLAAGDGLLLAAVAREGTGGPVGLLAPRLALVGAGQGLCITPLTTTVLSHTDPQRAGAVSGALSTMQQVGNALGVAITGLVFFGALSSGYAGAFERSLLQLACLPWVWPPSPGSCRRPGAPPDARLGPCPARRRRGPWHGPAAAAPRASGHPATSVTDSDR